MNGMWKINSTNKRDLTSQVCRPCQKVEVLTHVGGFIYETGSALRRVMCQRQRRIQHAGKELTAMPTHPQEVFSGRGMHILNSEPEVVTAPDKLPYGLPQHLRTDW